MGAIRHILNSIVAAFLIVLPANAGEAELDALFERLLQPDLENWEQIERAIWREWSSSGSASMDLLLQRGRQAMSQGDHAKAIDHFTALTDHAPEFAEGWNARATAYFGAERYSLSIADIGRTLSLNPRHFGAMQGLGRILEELGQPADALNAYEAAYAIHPHRDGLKEAIERLTKDTTGQDI